MALRFAALQGTGAMLCFSYREIFASDFVDVNECSASLPVCDINADCKNTPGSYRCSCKAGLTGDGKPCTGKRIAEC